eukprot:TRINITY_DN20190_c0_g1_i2.p1 TRINITY_DN20190_c0_g1~~TRINITY_DN20190_c0_g1_i2.p1  ORF type:complete len:299 (-),score=75.42 TRINITY_DN20190_c0_g1_i2:27-923(-)
MYSFESNSGYPFQLKPTRFHNDFIKLETLGKGGFGKVVKVKNRIDFRFYAIKVIPLKAKEREDILNEVRTLSGLFHMNIVRYYQSWIEDHNAILEDEEDSLSEEGFEVEKKKKGNKKDSLKPNKEDPFEKEDLIFETDPFDDSYCPSYKSEEENNKLEELDAHICWKCHNTDPWINDWEKLDLPWGEEKSNNCESCDKKQGNSNSIDSVQNQNPHTPQFLYIQMEFCEKTLKTVIQESTFVIDLFQPKDPSEICVPLKREIHHSDKNDTGNLAWKTFGQIVEGLAYIHSQGIIHRDVW